MKRMGDIPGGVQRSRDWHWSITSTSKTSILQDSALEHVEVQF